MGVSVVVATSYRARLWCRPGGVCDLVASQWTRPTCAPEFKNMPAADVFPREIGVGGAVVAAFLQVSPTGSPPSACVF